MFKGPLTHSVKHDMPATNHLDTSDYHVVKGKLQESLGYNIGRWFKLEYILPLKRCMLAGVELRCPNRVHAYLKIISRYLGYGNYMIPNKICMNGKWEEYRNNFEVFEY